ncbi:hypothetical protein [Variovorax sp. dw_954]|uniref:hypothetical protein n=1 Tax=Variovorax sp. dw_954 TaxID=2720078 RepID=UPI001BD308E2|nr:hypothetical protein [Variovorax sp. dw_954]
MAFFVTNPSALPAARLPAGAGRGLFLHAGLTLAAAGEHSVALLASRAWETLLGSALALPS